VRLAALMLLLATGASAQSIALSGQVGVTSDGAPSVMGAFDAYLSPRVSLRPSASWDDTSSLRRVGLQWEAVFNWDRDRWRPYLALGAGMHTFQTKVDGEVTGEHDYQNFGAGVGIGLERFLTHSTSLFGEVQYLAIERGRLPESPSALVVRFGLKRYF
jgi:hypothetical protein